MLPSIPGTQHALAQRRQGAGAMRCVGCSNAAGMCRDASGPKRFCAHRRPAATPIPQAAAAVAAAVAFHAGSPAAAHAAPVLSSLADVAEAQDLTQLGGVVGIALGGTFLALWVLERQASARNAAEAAAARADVAAQKEEIARLQQELEAETKKRKEAEGLEARLNDASKSILKLEKALEIKDGQLDVFMATARRQIKSLEDDLRQLQQMPR